VTGQKNENPSTAETVKHGEFVADSTYWRVNDGLPSSSNNNNQNTDEKNLNDISNLLQRTTLYTNNDVGLLPIWPKLSPENTAKSSIYASELWRLFATLDGFGIHRFTTDKAPAVSDLTLFGGRDNVADGASYGICTRYVQSGDKMKLIAIKRIKGFVVVTDGKTSEHLQ
jgi:hypothetical protein